MKLSIVIPIYKVEPFIFQCLNSILKQVLPKYSIEVILIDDGSPDASVEIIRPLIENLSYVRLIHQENQGLSSSRNRGLNLATGEYIWFVDSDDWLLPNALKDVYQFIERYPNVAVFSTILENHIEGKMPFNEYYPSTKFLSGKEYLTKHYRQGASQRFIFKKSFLIKNNLSFYPGILHEDGLFGFKMLYLAESVVILTNPVYAYRIRKEGSIMSSITMKTPQDMLFIHQELMRFKNQYVKVSDRTWYRHIIFSIIYDLFFFSRNLIFTSSFKQFYIANKQYLKNEASFAIFNRTTCYKGIIIRFFPLSFWKIRYVLKKILLKLKL